MKYSQSEKMEMIRMVEDSKLSVRKTLRQMASAVAHFMNGIRGIRSVDMKG